MGPYRPHQSNYNLKDYMPLTPMITAEPVIAVLKVIVVVLASVNVTDCGMIC
jgi:hypothetical protein